MSNIKPMNSSTRNLNEDLVGLTPTQKLFKIMSLIDHTLGTSIIYRDVTYKFMITTEYVYDTENNIIGVPASIFNTETTAPMFFKIFKALGTMLLKKNIIESPTTPSLAALDRHFDFKIKLNIIERSDILREMDLCCFAYRMQVCTPTPDKYILDMDFKSFVKDKNFETHIEATEAFDRYIMIQNLCREVMEDISNIKDEDSPAGTAKSLGSLKPDVKEIKNRLVEDVEASINMRSRRLPYYDEVEYICNTIINKKYTCMSTKDDTINAQTFLALDLAAKFILDELGIIRGEILKSKTERHQDIINSVLKLMKTSGGVTIIDQASINKAVHGTVKTIEESVREAIEKKGLLSYNDKVRIERERRFYEFRKSCGYNSNVTYTKLDEFPRIKQEFEEHLKEEPIVINR